MSEDYESLPQGTRLSVYITAGCMAGVMEHIVMYPIDTVSKLLCYTS